MDISSPTHLIVTVLFYILVIPLAILSAFGIYIFIRYGKTVGFTVLTSAIFIILFLIILANSFRLLGSV